LAAIKPPSAFSQLLIFTILIVQPEASLLRLAVGDRGGEEKGKEKGGDRVNWGR
jgi:hypothetical protein